MLTNGYKTTNGSIVLALTDEARIKSRTTELCSEINDRRSEFEKIDRIHEKLERVSRVQNGVATPGS